MLDPPVAASGTHGFIFFQLNESESCEVGGLHLSSVVHLLHELSRAWQSPMAPVAGHQAEFLRALHSDSVFFLQRRPPDFILTQPLQSGNLSQVSEEKACGTPRFPPRPPAASPRLRRGVDATTPRRPRDHTAASTPLPSQTRPPRDRAGRGPRRDPRDEATVRRATRGDIVAAASPRLRAMGPASRIVDPASPSVPGAPRRRSRDTPAVSRIRRLSGRGGGKPADSQAAAAAAASRLRTRERS